MRRSLNSRSLRVVMGMAMWTAMLIFFALGHAQDQSAVVQPETLVVNSSIGASIDAQEAQSIGCFPITPQFEKAFFVRVGERVYLVYHPISGDRGACSKLEVSPAWFSTFCQRVASGKPAPSDLQPTPRPLKAKDDSTGGRTFLVLSNTMVAGEVYGFGMPLLLDLDDSKGVGLGLMTWGAGFALSWRLSRNLKLGHGRSSFIVATSYLGTYLYGLGLPFLFDGTEKAYWASRMTLFPLSEFASYRWAASRDMSLAQSTSITWAGMSGMLIGADLAWLGVNNVELAEEGKVVVGTMMLGAPLGFWLGYRTLYNRSMTTGHADMLGVSALLGSYIAWATVFTIQDWAELRDQTLFNLMATSLLVGYTGGSYWGFRTGKGYSRGRAYLIGVGGVVGALFGAGTGLLLLPEDANDSRLISGLSAVGTVGGTLLARHWTKGFKEEIIRAGMKKHKSLGLVFDFSGVKGLPFLLASRRLGHSGPCQLEVARIHF